MVVVDVGEYCRSVEDHLTQVNGGHLVRIVGPAFDLVREWAEAGIPTSIVFRGIDRKAERHRAGRSTRPLRLEFCEADVREIYLGWRRAVGLVGIDEAGSDVDGVDRSFVADARPTTEVDSSDSEVKRPPSLSRHLDRAIDRLSRALGRADVPDDLRTGLDVLLQELVDVRASAKKARGEAREALKQRLKVLDDQLGATLRSLAPAAALQDAQRDAESELAGYKGRLPADAWPRAVSANTDRLLRDRYGLPTL